jgi:hypothetical protein
MIDGVGGLFQQWRPLTSETAPAPSVTTLASSVTHPWFFFRTMQAQPNSPAVVQLPVVLPTLTGVDPSWSKRPYALRTVDVKKQPLAGELSVCGGEP